MFAPNRRRQLSMSVNPIEHDAMAKIEQVACILAELPPVECSMILNRLSSAEREKLKQIGDANRPARHDAIRDFLAQTAEYRGEAKSGCASEEANPLNEIARYSTEEIVFVLRRERSTTVAAVLFALPPDLAAGALAELPYETRVPVIRAIANSALPNRATTAALLKAVSAELACQIGLRQHGRRANQGVRKIHSILASAEPTIQLQLSATIDQADERIAERITKIKSA